MSKIEELVDALDAISGDFWESVKGDIYKSGSEKIVLMRLKRARLKWNDRVENEEGIVNYYFIPKIRKKGVTLRGTPGPVAEYDKNSGMLTILQDSPPIKTPEEEYPWDLKKLKKMGRKKQVFYGVNTKKDAYAIVDKVQLDYDEIEDKPDVVYWTYNDPRGGRLYAGTWDKGMGRISLAPRR